MLIPPPAFQQKSLDDPLPKLLIAAFEWHHPPPPIRYGDTDAEGTLYTRLPETLVNEMLPSTPPLKPNRLYAPSILIPSGTI